MNKTIPCLILIGSLLSAAQNDIFPTDYVANRPGDIIATLYLSSSEAGAYYRHNRPILDESTETSIQALRLGYTTEILGATTTFTTIGVHAKTSFDGQVLEALYPKTTSGYGDLRLGITSWLINNPEKMEYFALTPMISIPIGTYNASRAVNIGENRYKATLNAGYVNRFLNGNAGELFIELSPEIAFYGDNTNAQGRKIEQEPSYALTGYLRYRPIPIVGLFTGYQINRGGETTVDGVHQNDEPNNSKWMVGGSLFAYGIQFILRHAQDTHIENGFKNNRQTTLRLQWNLNI